MAARPPSRCGNDRAAVCESAPLLLVDVEMVEQPAAYQTEHFLRRRRAMVVENDRTTGPFVVTAGAAQAVDDFIEDFARAAAQPVGTERKLHLPVENARRQRPVDLVETNEEVGDLGDDVGLRDVPAPGYDQLVVQERIGQRGLERGEMALGKLGVADLGQQVLVGSREEPDQGRVIERSGLARIARGLRFDSVKQGPWPAWARRKRPSRSGNWSRSCWSRPTLARMS